MLVAARNPLNIGAAARAMSNFGITCLRVVNPYSIAFREARSAVGAAAVLESAEEFATLAEATADCSLVVGTTAATSRHLQQNLRTLQEGAPLLRDRLQSSAVAVVFGSEKRGLSNDDLSHCHWLLNIPTHDQHKSMNLGQAVAVCLYELTRDTVAGPVESVEFASAAQIDRITSGLVHILKTSGYFNAASSSSAEQRVRRFVRRLSIHSADSEMLLGMLRQISWKLDSDSA